MRLLSSLAALALCLAALELAALALFPLIDGRGFSYRRLAAERARVVAEGRAPALPAPGRGSAAGGEREAPEPRGRPERTAAQLAPHPFVGFVYDPESPWLEASLKQGGLPLSEQGFFVVPGPPGEGEEWTLAVFGGSLATFLAIDGRQALSETLAASPRLRGRRIRVRSFALGGYKQPQMAQALMYLSSLGERFDAVVELDGFNELALSVQEHRATGKFPFYPRDWERLVGPAPGPDELRRLGRIAYLQALRAEQAQAFSRRPLRWSVAAALVWRSLDRRLSRQLAAAREAAAARRSAADSYALRGPRRRYPSDQALFAELARVWGLSSLQMHRLCAGAGIAYHHFLQPNQYVPGSKPMGAAERRLAFRADHPYRSAVERGYPLLQAEGRELRRQGVPFSDLVPLFAGVREPMYADDCCHLNAAGYERLGRRIGADLAADLAGR